MRAAEDALAASRPPGTDDAAIAASLVTTRCPDEQRGSTRVARGSRHPGGQRWADGGPRRGSAHPRRPQNAGAAPVVHDAPPSATSPLADRVNPQAGEAPDAVGRQRERGDGGAVGGGAGLDPAAGPAPPGAWPWKALATTTVSVAPGHDELGRGIARCLHDRRAPLPLTTWCPANGGRVEPVSGPTRCPECVLEDVVHDARVAAPAQVHALLGVVRTRDPPQKARASRITTCRQSPPGGRRSARRRPSQGRKRSRKVRLRISTSATPSSPRARSYDAGEVPPVPSVSPQRHCTGRPPRPSRSARRRAAGSRGRCPAEEVRSWPRRRRSTARWIAGVSSTGAVTGGAKVAHGHRRRGVGVAGDPASAATSSRWRFEEAMTSSRRCSSPSHLGIEARLRNNCR